MPLPRASGLRLTDLWPSVQVPARLSQQTQSIRNTRSRLRSVSLLSTVYTNGQTSLRFLPNCSRLVVSPWRYENPSQIDTNAPRLTDTSRAYAIQRNTSQASRLQTIVTMSQSSPSDWCSPTCTGCILAYSCGLGCRIVLKSVTGIVPDGSPQTEGLKRDLHLWSSGLFPFFEYAATSVKVSVATIPSKVSFNIQCSPLCSPFMTRTTLPCKVL